MKMRLIYISDIHGRFDALGGLPKADLLVVGGDFTQFGSLRDFKEAVEKVEAVSPSYLAVTGNLDVPEGDCVLSSKGHLLSPEDVLECCGLRFAGISGANRSPFNTPYEWDDAAMEERLARFGKGAFDVLVSHTPPFDCGADTIGSGASVGSRAVRGLVERVRPLAVLCGHIHEARGIYSLGGIPVVNPGPFGDRGGYAVVQFDRGKGASAWLETVC